MKMRGLSNLSGSKSKLNAINRQPCVNAVRRARLPKELKKEIKSFIQRNTLEDCGKVPPNCLKAHMIKTAIHMGMNQNKITQISRLFKSKIGFNGYYLDAGKLRRVKLPDYLPDVS